jgi:hypothetical protein
VVVEVVVVVEVEVVVVVVIVVEVVVVVVVVTPLTDFFVAKAEVLLDVLVAVAVTSPSWVA